ncbi:fungal-specific transcription factor domain-containing protein [Penicillium longicatenatum]|uniref:fungal-specific transcription factor domain-containing protein n=1 Tax=Penicillium longicatenatum TaxID=1561947 RepID=UPI0025469B62|nr:fungal-specific transcription factor domain-containing protein [Penicillium longicatenatum]KAJ5661376.1 fungal-specific transcription factor domain-containing protein [Penicillium longicatenatum]
MPDLAESAVMTPAARKTMQELEKRRYNTDHDTTTELLRRVATLEAKIENFGSSLQRIEECMVALLDGDNSRRIGLSTPAKQGDNRPGKSDATTERAVSSNAQLSESLFEDFGMPEDVFMAVIDAYFHYCHNQPYSFFHEENFRQRLRAQIIPKHLVLTVVATAVRFCPHPYFARRVHEASVDYANRAWKLIVADCFTVGKVAEVSTVQTVALLGLFDFTAGRSRHGSAWVKVGLAVRIAQDCGLMLENATSLPYAEQEERRRVFWSVFLLDRLVSCGRGRPPAIVDASCHLQLPSDEPIWRSGLWTKTQSLDEMANRTLPVTQRQGAFARVIAIAQILGRSAQFMLQDSNIRNLHPPWDPSSEFAAMESDLLHFEAYLEIQLPVKDVLAPHISAEGVVDSQSTGPIIFSRALFHLCYCLLNHPFLLRRRIDTCRNLAPMSFMERSSDLAWHHAQQMMTLIREARKCGCSFHSSSSGYAVTVAGSIIALRTYDSDPQVFEKAQVLLDEALLYLDTVGQHWSNVITMASMLRRMVYNGFLGSSLLDWTQPSTLTQMEEETLWAVVDYNTMSDQDADDTIMDEQTTDGALLSSWVELFGTVDYSSFPAMSTINQH